MLELKYHYLCSRRLGPTVTNRGWLEYQVLTPVGIPLRKYKHRGTTPVTHSKESTSLVGQIKLKQT